MEKVKIHCMCGCGRSFVTKKPWHIFASTKCKNFFNREMIRKGKTINTQEKKQQEITCN